MTANLLNSLAGTESWSVTYESEVYEDARKWSEIWYFRRTPGEEFARFAMQDKVTPICKNPTRKKRPFSR